jgi:hypothetical protein
MKHRSYGSGGASGRERAARRLERTGVRGGRPSERDHDSGAEARRAEVFFAESIDAEGGVTGVGLAALGARAITRLILRPEEDLTRSRCLTDGLGTDFMAMASTTTWPLATPGRVTDATRLFPKAAVVVSVCVWLIPAGHTHGCP